MLLFIFGYNYFSSNVISWIYLGLIVVSLLILLIKTAIRSETPLLHAIADYIGDYWTDISLVIFGVVTTISTYMFSDEAIRYWWDSPDIKHTDLIYKQFKFWSSKGIIFGILGTLIIGFFHFRKQNRLSTLENKIGELESEQESVLHDLGAVIRGYLWGIVENLNFGPDDRVTLYSHEAKIQSFIPLERISLNPIFNKKSRTSYPDNEGYIAKAWQEGFAFEENLPSFDTAKKKYINKAKQVNFPESLHSVVRMKSRLYFGWRITDSKNEIPLAVLMIESLAPDRWTKEELEKYFLQEKKKFCNIFERVHKNLPEYSEAREKGF